MNGTVLFSLVFNLINDLYYWCFEPKKKEWFYFFIFLVFDGVCEMREKDPNWTASKTSLHWCFGGVLFEWELFLYWLEDWVV